MDIGAWQGLMVSLAKVAKRLINEVREINRVMYDVSGKPPRDDRVE